METTHQCEHHHQQDFIPDRLFKIGILLNLLFVCIEIYFGVFHNSIALVSDAVHNLTDVFGLLLAWLGYRLSKSRPTEKFRFGFKKVSVLAAFVNASFLLLSSIWLIVESYHRFQLKQEPVAMTMITVAMVGCLINFFTARQFHKHHQHDLNIKAAYLHLMADAAISVGVVLAGIIIFYTNAFWVDPAISILISVVIIYGTFGLLKESTVMLLDGVPSSIDLKEVKNFLLQQTGITVVNEIQIWALSTSENAMNVDVQMTTDFSESQLKKLKHQLEHKFRMTHISIVRSGEKQ